MNENSETYYHVVKLWKCIIHSEKIASRNMTLSDVLSDFLDDWYNLTHVYFEGTSSLLKIKLRPALDDGRNNDFEDYMDKLERYPMSFPAGKHMSMSQRINITKLIQKAIDIANERYK